MSQNLIEKLQEIWNVIQQDPTIRKGQRHWRKIQKSDGYKIAVSAVSDIGRTLGKANRYLLKKGKIYALVALNLLSSGSLSGSQVSSMKKHGDNDDPISTRKEFRLTDVQAHLQAAYSAEELENLCSKLISTDSIFNQLCAERSQLMGDEVLRVANEIQSQIGGNKGKNRSQILKQRWGKDVPVGLHCLRSALEVMTEASQNTDTPEFIDTFIQKIRQTNPNSYYGLKGTFSKHRNYKSSTRSHNLTQIITEETKDNPHDIFLIAHKSKGNHTGSGYHMVLYYNGIIVSFNGECIETAAEYFKYRSTQGDIINISKTVREDGKAGIVRQIAGKIKSDIAAGKVESFQTLLAMYMGDKDIPLQNRIQLGSDAQQIMPLVASVNPLDNFNHLRHVRAKLAARQTEAGNVNVRTTQKKTAIRPANGSKQHFAQNRRVREAKDSVHS